MNSLLYPKLAAQNIGKNAKLYIPYFLTGMGSTMMYYTIDSLARNETVLGQIGGNSIALTMRLGSIIIAFFATIFLLYTNSFLIKRRRRELGLYNILGMEKRHIAWIMLYETIYTMLICIAGGILIGILVNKLCFLILLKLAHLEVQMGFDISIDSIVTTAVIFAVIYFIALLKNLIQIKSTNPIELLNSSRMGEKEPKTKWFITILGLVTLGYGYYIACTVEDPLEALMLFFVAVILVIIGTFCLFTQGSIALLKLLRKNKRYYYKTRHFISVSGMLYRMKQNAAGLASICILSTMAIVTLSTTVSLYIGLDEVLQNRYPRDIMITSYDYSDNTRKEIDQSLKKIASKYGLGRHDYLNYRYLGVAASESGDELKLEKYVTSGNGIGTLRSLYFVPLEDYNRIYGENLVLDESEAYIYTNRTRYEGDDLKIAGLKFRVKDNLNNGLIMGSDAAQLSSSHFIIVKDMSVLEQIDKIEREMYESDKSGIRSYFAFNLDTQDEKCIEVYNDIKADFKDNMDTKFYYECKASSWRDFYSIYGGLFFIGVFLGSMFIMATVLVIYYKQISEGYEDSVRFEIMQKVGLSRQEIRGSIRSQVLIVFFLPLLASIVHIAFAFRVIAKMLAVFALSNIALYAWCTVGVLAVFAIAYIAVYVLTSRVYYNIVSR